jgi:formamidopyrimidine-DNA glycosylase
MPELPEVEIVRQSLEVRVTGLKIEEVKVLTPSVARSGEFSDFREILLGKIFRAFKRRGKYLIAHLSEGISLVAHLRMTGRWVYTTPEIPVPKHTHIIFVLSNGAELRFTDIRRFGGIDIVLTDFLPQYKSLTKLGVEPLSEEFTSEYLGALVKNKKLKIKALILDQTRLAGLGNIYADEALFLAGVNPQREASTLREPEIIQLHGAIREVLEKGIANKGTSFSDYVDGEGNRGQNQLSLNVYGRYGEHCNNCGTTLAKLKIGGRTSVYCPLCQNPE